jgi:phosphoglycerate dehydrogenase-like enzyme
MPGLNAAPVAEHAIALLLALARRLPEARDGFQTGGWGEPSGRSLAGTTAAVIGLGAVGTQIARRLAAFDVNVIGVSRRPDPSGRPSMPGVQIAALNRLHDVLRAADSVLIAARYNAGQPTLIDAAAIAVMRAGAMVVNIARGGLLDDHAALAALNAGRLGGLGVDVYPQEPYPADGPLLGHPRVIATAHTAALTSGFFHAAAERLGEALHRWTSGRPVEHLVTVDRPQ